MLKARRAKKALREKGEHEKLCLSPQDPKAWAAFLARGSKLHKATKSYGRIWSRSTRGLLELSRELASGANGNVYEKRMCHDLFVVVKEAKAMNGCDFDCSDPLTFEFAVLYVLSGLRHRIPNFPLAYGVLWTEPSDGGPGQVPVLVTERIEAAQTMSDWLRVQQVTHTEQSEREVVRAMLQVLGALMMAMERYDFTHWDLHTQNVVWQQVEKKTLGYSAYGQSFRVNTDGRAWMIIDCGRGT